MSLKKAWLHAVQSVLSPPVRDCISCYQPIVDGARPEHLGFCPSCYEQIPWIRQVVCPICGRYEECPDCVRWGKTPLIQNRSAVQYSPEMKEMLARYKYRGDEALCEAMSDMLVYAFVLSQSANPLKAAKPSRSARLLNLFSQTPIAASPDSLGQSLLASSLDSLGQSRMADRPDAFGQSRSAASRNPSHLAIPLDGLRQANSANRFDTLQQPQTANPINRYGESPSGRPIGSSFKVQPCLTFVPLSQERLAERGFNQAEQLARRLGAKIKLPVVDLLVRHRHTDKQSHKTRSARLQDLEHVFALRTDLSRASFPMLRQGGGPLRIYIVDDVYTTGSTLIQCASAIQRVWPSVEVFGLTWAR